MTTGLRRLEAADLDGAVSRAEISFGSPQPDPGLPARLEARIGAGQVWGWVEDGRVVAHCMLWETEHWFAGGRVPCQHVASVAVPPEHRGRGVASALLRAAISQGADAGLGLSLLFPATTGLYRRAGYEHAGVITRYRLDARHADPVGDAMEPAGADDWAAIVACYRRVARTLNGPEVERGEQRWKQLRGSRYHYVLRGAGGEVEAYVLFDHRRDPGDWQYRLAVGDWAAATPAGMLAVVGLFGRHGTIGSEATLRGPLPDPLSFYLAEQDLELRSAFWWMARGLDLETAVAARGFPPGMTGTVAFALDDPVLAGASGTWRLAIADGAGRLERAVSEPVQARLDVRALGPLFTGFRDPAALRLGGLVEGDDDALAFLAGAFAVPMPVLFDFF